MENTKQERAFIRMRNLETTEIETFTADANDVIHLPEGRWTPMPDMEIMVIDETESEKS